MSGERDDDKTWAELIDAFHTEPDPQDDDLPRWPAAENIDAEEQQSDAEEQQSPSADESVDDTPDPYFGASRTLGDFPAGAPSGHGQQAFSHHVESSDAYVTDDDHFIPPNPPPMPRGDRITRWAWTGLIAAPSVLLLSSVMGWSPPDEFMALLIGGFIAGFVTLIARMRGRNPHDPDNGAVV